MSIEKNNKTDRRIVRTRRSLRQAFYDLVLEQGYDAVTVEDITNRADLGRTTFYLHYRDKEDLLMESVRDLVDGLIAQLAQVPLNQWKLPESSQSTQEIPLTAITYAFQHVAQNANLYRIILRGEGTYSASRRLRDIIIRAITELIEGFSAHQGLIINPQVPLEVFLNGLSGAWIGLVSWWLEEDRPYTPEQMAVMYDKMFMRSTDEVLGLAGLKT
jgi:AcrR family transcriptional regulator